MQIEITTQTHDSSTTDLMAMFDVAASLLRAITGALSSAITMYMQLGTVPSQCDRVRD